MSYLDTLDKVAPKFIRLNRFFNAFIKANIKNEKLFQEVTTKGVPMIFSGGKIVSPHKIHQLYYKRVSLTFTEEMAHYVNTGLFPA